jgi:prepilin-type processing-associated H-X9-DG protein
MDESTCALLACSHASDLHASWISRLDPNWVIAGISTSLFIVILCTRFLRRLNVVASLGVVTALALLLVPAVQAAREAARQASCNCNLKQFGIALHNYHDQYGCFPPPYIADAKGRPMHSWRVLLLPYLGGKQVYDQYKFDEPWNGPHNRLLADKMPALLRCPSDDVSGPQETSYAAVVGPETMWRGDKVVRLKDVTDGTENTLVIAEVAGGGIEWMEPRDLPVREARIGINTAPRLGICSRHSKVAMVVFADGSVHALQDTIAPELLDALFTRGAGDRPPQDIHMP